MFTHYIMKSLGHAKPGLQEGLSSLEERWKMLHAPIMPSDFCVWTREPVIGLNHQSNCGSDERGALQCSISGTILELRYLYANLLEEDSVQRVREDFVRHQATQGDTPLG